MSSAVSTKIVFKRIWQRILTTQILQLQIDQFLKGGYHHDIKEILNKSDELACAQPCTLLEPKFTKEIEGTYKLQFKKQGVPFELLATIEVPAAYPDKPTTVTVDIEMVG